MPTPKTVGGVRRRLSKNLAHPFEFMLKRGPVLLEDRIQPFSMQMSVWLLHVILRFPDWNKEFHVHVDALSGVPWHDEGLTL